MFGFFSLSADNTKNSGTISGVGAYQLAYRQSFLQQFEFQIAYSLIASKIYTGDLGFGPDLGIYYFPFSNSSGVDFSHENISFKSQEYLKPFIAAGFHQRQYQSTQSSFAGFSASVGAEYFLYEKLSLKSELRLINLAGPNSSKASEIDLLLGLTFSY